SGEVFSGAAAGERYVAYSPVMPFTASWTATWMIAMTRVCWTGARADAGNNVSLTASLFHSVTASTPFTTGVVEVNLGFVTG
ncbi:MAG: hypothetical protein M3R15_04915, partial [Acidobacteriota bacterium]|nr:hypothetical protein [Acidobacteriota bacterium]